MTTKKGKTLSEFAAEMGELVRKAKEPYSVSYVDRNEDGEMIFLDDPIVTGIPPAQPKLRKRKPRAMKPAAEPSGMLTAAEAAAMLGVSAKLVYRLFHRGELEGVKVAGAVRIHRASVDAYLSAHSNKKPAPLVEVPPQQPTPQPKRRRRTARSEGFRFLPP